MDHSFLPPSGASAWSRCALWPTMNARYPQADTLESIEGTAAHWVAWEILAGRMPVEGSATPAGAIVTDEMLDGGELLVDTIRELIPKPIGFGLRVEQRLSIPQIHPDCFGTADVWADNTHEPRVLHIIDYKFGHRFVDEYFNPQGLLYLLGILNVINASNWKINEGIKVCFTIVQPRCYYRGESVRSHTFYVRDAIKHFEQLEEAASRATEPNPPATTNAACNTCPGRHACDTLQKAAYSDAEFASDRQPHDLTPAAAGLELRMLERALQRLEARVDGLRELTLVNIRKGESVPYYRVEAGRPRTVWTSDVDTIISLGQIMGHDLAKPGVVTPLAAKKLGIDHSVISAYSHTPTGSLKLVATNPSDVRKVFGNE